MQDAGAQFLASLTSWDYVVALIGLMSIAWGFFKGFIRSVFGLGAWILAFVVPWFLIPKLVPGGLATLELPLPVWVANLLVFFFVFILVQIIGSKLAKLLGKAGLSGTDRFFGALWGAARGVLLLAVVVGVSAAMGLTKNEAWAKAQTRPYLDQLYAVIEPLFPAKSKATKGVQARAPNALGAA
jgi:membrane protein required for colicin V production